MDIIDRLKYLRKDYLKITQKELGIRIGLKANSISDIEVGKNTLTEQNIKTICREFRINEDWLRDGIEPMLVSTDTELEDFFLEISFSKDNFIKNFIKAYNKLNQSQKDAIQEFSNNFMQFQKEKGC